MFLGIEKGTKGYYYLCCAIFTCVIITCVILPVLLLPRPCLPVPFLPVPFLSKTLFDFSFIISIYWVKHK